MGGTYRTPYAGRLATGLILMIISISIHYDAGNECAVIHRIQQENLHAIVAMATIHNCAYNGLESFY